MNRVRAYVYAAEVMVENMTARDAQVGICAFVEKRAAARCTNAAQADEMG